MSGAPQPPVIPEPFANDADPSFITAIPDTSTDPGRASWSLGFPPKSMTPVEAGGTPPFGQDANGAMFAMSSHDFYVQSGQLYLFSSAVATSIGGYGVGTILGSTDRQTVWYNLVDANTTDPDSGSAAGWVALFSGGPLILSGLTTGTTTLSATQAARKVIILSGALTGNVTIVLPTWKAPAGRWLFVNNTTGAFVVTARTAAGTGVAIPAGGPGAPLEVYGDGTNIYPAVSPLAVPISQGPDPLTLAERTNTGQIAAVSYSASGAIDNEPIGYVMTGITGDNILRKTAIAFFQSSLGLSGFAGQVTASQVPLAAVIQYVAQILANAALTGTPTTPTAAPGTSTTQVASTAFVVPGFNFATNGHYTLPGGLILNWGAVSVANSTGAPIDTNITFDQPYTTTVYGIWPVTNRSVTVNGQAVDGSNFSSAYNLAGGTITIDASGGSLSNARWFALGK